MNYDKKQPAESNNMHEEWPHTNKLKDIGKHRAKYQTRKLKDGCIMHERGATNVLKTKLKCTKAERPK